MMYLAAMSDNVRSLVWSVIGAASLAALGAITRWIGGWIKAKRELITIRRANEDTRENTLTEVAKMYPLLTKIAAEFRVNGGSTFRDDLNKNTAMTAELQKTVAAIKTKLELP